MSAEEGSILPLEAELVRVRSFSREDVPSADITVATYWTTIEPALALDTTQIVHYCQGFEGNYTHNRDQHSDIEAAYSHPLPALVVAPHLETLLGDPTKAHEKLGWTPKISFEAMVREMMETEDGFTVEAELPGIKAKEIDLSERRPAHLTFVIDTSGSNWFTNVALLE